MRKLFRAIMACALALIMLSISPMADISRSLGGAADSDSSVAKAATVARAAESAGNQLYISDVKLGNVYYKDGPTEEEVVNQLKSEGYQILMDGSDYADLNSEADAPSIKEGPNRKKVLFGYKTTTDPNDAITDLAVMNMEGGYSIEDYKKLINMQMDSHIKPFMDRFIDTLEEYRANCNKPIGTLNRARADRVRKVLNRFTDDDTGGQPLGELLLNKTKYEMGDAEYNELSYEEREEHADILTLLMQANGRALLTVETLLTMGSDKEENTWYERFVGTTLEDLINDVRGSNKNLTTRADIYNELDKRYEDTAKELLNKWKDFRKKMLDYRDNTTEIAESIDESVEKKEELSQEDMETLIKEDSEEFVEVTANSVHATNQMQELMIGMCLESTEYEGETLLDFFTQDYDDVSTGTGIRKLYPMVHALSDGQIAGLEFVSLEDLFTMALTSKEAYEEEPQDLPDMISVYDGVNREIYDTAGVGLTSAKKRSDHATNDEVDNVFGVRDMSGWLIASWVTTLVSTVGLGVSVYKAVKAGKEIAGKAIQPTVIQKTSDLSDAAQRVISKFGMEKWNDLAGLKSLEKTMTQISKGTGDTGSTVFQENLDAVTKRVKELETAEKEAATEASSQTNMASYVALGFSLCMVVFLTLSIVFTIKELRAYYKTKYALIPKYMVDEVDITATNERGEKIMVENQTAYYKAVTCNRIEGSSDQEKDNFAALGDRADVNGDIGKQWLALYAVKYKNAMPILADSLLYRKGGGDMPAGYSTGIHEFGSKAAADLNRKAYLFTKSAPTIQVFFKNAEPVQTTAVLDGSAGETGEPDASNPDAATGAAVSGAAGSLIGGSGSGITASGVALGGGIGIALGGFLGALFMFLARRKRYPGEPE